MHACTSSAPGSPSSPSRIVHAPACRRSSAGTQPTPGEEDEDGASFPRPEESAVLLGEQATPPRLPRLSLWSDDSSNIPLLRLMDPGLPELTGDIHGPVAGTPAALLQLGTVAIGDMPANGVDTAKGDCWPIETAVMLMGVGQKLAGVRIAREVGEPSGRLCSAPAGRGRRSGA
mmetsp:Transcript_73677/g.219906  ORF Transcript_73677/g.219906 Transcript_73677/m.219906 type:complete len:174 (-) Transcript_73677:231-752(-)